MIEYYLSTKKGNHFITYVSDCFKFSEIELLQLIKLCIILKRSKTIGNKILAVYKDSMELRGFLKEAEEKLKKIGIENDKRKPIFSKSNKQK
jgi:hypothetical protein